MKRCIVCGQTQIHPLINLGKQPLVTMNRPKAQKEAQEAKQYPLDFYMCAFCGHVFNVAFDIDELSYVEDSCHMYNKGASWQQHIRSIVEKLSGFDYWKGFAAIDIGCGDGEFFSAMLQRNPDEKFLGFEPGVDAEGIKDYPVIVDYFTPERDLAKYKPRLLCLRHVVEHLTNPREFLSDIVYWSAKYHVAPMLYVEVPCFEVGFETGRTEDLLYEHVSHFTASSFRTLMEVSGYKIIEMVKEYNDEVICCIAVPKTQQMQNISKKAEKYIKKAVQSFTTVKCSLDVARQAGQSVALWGGTGKSAAFINTYRLDGDRFPIVVDSDEVKCGYFVPGTGQEIVHSTHLLENPVDVIVITTHWRAVDIYQEIVHRGISYDRVLFLDNNMLVDYRE